MKLISVNVGVPRSVTWKGETVTTGIFKNPVEGRLRVGKLNLEGDRQADLSVHGGPDKAVYAYPMEHYSYWRKQLGGEELGWGMFGENFTTQGLLETSVKIGDRFRIGSAELVVTQPRVPCYKLGLKFARDDMVKLFMASGRSGVYFRVLKEGEAGAGDALEQIGREQNSLSVSDITNLYTQKTRNHDLLDQAARLEALPEGWRAHFRRRMETAPR